MEIHTETCDLDEDCTCHVSRYAEWSGPRCVPNVTQAFWVGAAAAVALTGAFVLTVVLLFAALL